MSTFVIVYAILALLAAIFMGLIARIRWNRNEADIPEDVVASAIEGDLRTFVVEENARRCTARLVNYTAADQARYSA